MLEINELGGVVPESIADQVRARKSDLITLPPNIWGTNCGNCKFVRNVGPEGFGFCSHPKVLQPVSARMCCAFWDANGVLRDF